MDNYCSMEARGKLIETFISELPVLRARAKVSQETVAEKVGISRQTYSGIETGRRDMSWTNFLALIAFFQNNDATRKIVYSIPGFNSQLSPVIETTD